MIILGLDPGIARTGFGLISINPTETFIRCGCLTTPAHQDTADRIYELGKDLQQVITEAKPDLAVVEQVYFGTNTTTAIQTAHVRGMLVYILRQHHIPIQSLTPLQIKSRLTGYGKATKVQVQSTVTRRLGLTTAPQPDDAADALAAALCYVDNQKNISRMPRYNKSEV